VLPLAAAAPDKERGLICSVRLGAVAALHFATSADSKTGLLSDRLSPHSLLLQAAVLGPHCCCHCSSLILERPTPAVAIIASCCWQCLLPQSGAALQVLACCCCCCLSCHCCCAGYLLLAAAGAAKSSCARGPTLLTSLLASSPLAAAAAAAICCSSVSLAVTLCSKGVRWVPTGWFSRYLQHCQRQESKQDR
jgi:hypothetical protein